DLGIERVGRRGRVKAIATALKQVQPQVVLKIAQKAACGGLADPEPNGRVADRPCLHDSLECLDLTMVDPGCQHNIPACQSLNYAFDALCLASPSCPAGSRETAAR